MRQKNKLSFILLLYYNQGVHFSLSLVIRWGWLRMWALTSDKWGQQQESLINTYKASIISLFTYASPILLPYISPTSKRNLQLVKNAAMCIATRSVNASVEGHLHAETKMLPVKDHLSLLSSHFLATARPPFLSYSHSRHRYQG